MKKRTLLFIACVLLLLELGACAKSHIENSPTLQTTAPTTPTEPVHIDRLEISLNGDPEIYLEYGQTYEEPGATAQFIGKDTTEDVSVAIQGQVDTSLLGSYVITYTAERNGLASTKSRTIHIVDTQLPIITLTTDPYAFTIPGQPYKEEGFQAFDDYDGDITHLVQSTESDGIVTYTVSDSSGNTCTILREIYYFDPGRPNLKLLGSDIYLLAQGDFFVDPGVIAFDKNDGDITNAVLVEGDINTAVPGRYTLEYVVSNSYCYIGSVQRTIIVLPMEHLVDKTKDTKKTAEPAPPDNFYIHPKDCMIPEGGMPYQPTGKNIYLTFDDGPGPHTERLLDILATYDVKVSFFVINTKYIDTIARAAKEGHTVAIHTYSHNYGKIYASDEAFLADLEAIQQVIAQHTGQTAMLTRFPGGSSNTVSKAYNKGIMTRLTKTLTEMGYTYFDWNVDGDDAGKASTPEEVFKNITKGVKHYNNSVVLQHDIKGYSVDAVERLIAWGLVNGYTFCPLTADSPTCHHPVLN